jgi:hypothetical protein
MVWVETTVFTRGQSRHGGRTGCCSGMATSRSIGVPLCAALLFPAAQASFAPRRECRSARKALAGPRSSVHLV